LGASPSTSRFANVYTFALLARNVLNSLIHWTFHFFEKKFSKKWLKTLIFYQSIVEGLKIPFTSTGGARDDN
jgi:hypothetical protein